MDASPPPREQPTVVVEGLSRVHHSYGADIRSLDGVSLTVDAGEVVALMGPSGSGKTTLLHLIAGLDRPDAGTIRVLGVDWQTLPWNERAEFRRHACGFVAQGLSLLPQATAAENVEISLLLDGVDAEHRARRVQHALDRVGLADHAGKLPDQLSGGQQQRVAIARALVAKPSVLLADEPTGSLDSATARQVIGLLIDLAAEASASIVLVTHDPAIGQFADRVLRLRSGRLESALP
jgi:putative ABC transport system ATP-binding protein